MKETKDNLENLQTLKKREDFVAANKADNKWVSDTLILQITEGQPKKVEYGVTVTKKLGSAVIRNRIKRRLRSAIAEILPKQGQQGMRYVVIGRKAALEQKAEKLRSDLKWCLKRLHASQEQ